MALDRDRLIKDLQSKLILKNTEKWQTSREDKDLKLVAGMDISFVKDDPDAACAALVIVDFPSLKVLYDDMAMVKLTEEYCPGHLGFRELPGYLKCFTNLRQNKPELWPQVVLIDGNGILHPKGVGSACHLGVAVDIPAVGVAKSLFNVDGLEKNEDHSKKVKNLKKAGDTFPLVGKSGNVLGMALRGCAASRNPVYVSVGHKIDLDTAVWLVTKCCKFRVPEPVRQADIRSREYLRQIEMKDTK